ncbi:hypothetical protein SMALA_5291 [Streptomyces malaysiensis subsp. malaysiensis]|nr:hypothetical protein SMALA_5291 [Streptomyces malaysiensis]
MHHLAVEVGDHLFTHRVERLDVVLPALDKITVGVADRAIRNPRFGVQNLEEGAAAPTTTSGSGPMPSEAATCAAGTTLIRCPYSARCRWEWSSHCTYGVSGFSTTRTRVTDRLLPFPEVLLVSGPGEPFTLLRGEGRRKEIKHRGCPSWPR